MAARVARGVVHGPGVAARAAAAAAPPSTSDDECLVCLEPVTRASAVWQCDGCWAVLHLACAGEHAAASVGPANKLLASVLPNLPRSWACPHCRKQFAEAAAPARYLCFCGKCLDPPDDIFLPPHTCGAPCGRPRAPCGHGDAARCHAGPCEGACPLTVDVPCFCGARVERARCGAAPASCGGRCGRARACGHSCAAPCHAGACAPCLLPVAAACACGRAPRRTLPCSRSAWLCDAPCAEPLACGSHACEKRCHAPGECSVCPATAAAAAAARSPAAAAAAAQGLRSCPCGKVRAAGAVSCAAPPLPPCGDTCGARREGCAHICENPCHAGACPPCAVIVTGRPCPCGATRARARCSDAPALCDKRATHLKACGRHVCKRRCCAGPAPAAPTAAAAAGDGGGAGGRPVPAAAGGLSAAAADDAARHCEPCKEECSRTLSCGRHAHRGACHAGACPPCPIVNDVSCACGAARERRPCGASEAPPSCVLACRRARACGHRGGRAHKCHPGGTPCPPCSLPCGAPRRCGHGACEGACGHAGPCPLPCAAFVERRCVGGHEARRVPCSSAALFACAAGACDEALACGEHTCGKAACHPRRAPGCEGGLLCPRPCARPRPDGCEHACAIGGCHGRATACPPCAARLAAPCHCGAEPLVTTTCAAAGAARAAGVDWRACDRRCAARRPCGHACSAPCAPHACAGRAPGGGDARGGAGEGGAAPTAAPAACAKRATLRCACGARRKDAACADAVAARVAAGLRPDAAGEPALPCAREAGCARGEGGEPGGGAAGGAAAAGAAGAHEPAPRAPQQHAREGAADAAAARDAARGEARRRRAAAAAADAAAAEAEAERDAAERAASKRADAEAAAARTAAAAAAHARTTARVAVAVAVALALVTAAVAALAWRD